MKNFIYFLSAYISLCLLLGCSTVCSDLGTWYRENLTPLEYKGIIARKFFDPKQRELAAFMLTDSMEYICYNGHAYDTAEVGDSIIKNAGTLKHILKKIILL